ncbi:MAG: L-glutamate gamma-semialdehyde dehydrogenase [Bacteroidota bacterium]|nr:L-glutamate gamma-semialdehyde dehydrogenase [Bacteroidota bacterium]MEC8367486.1 L-glutamate gamma-semialdehyde dehydrogenase [Bacteroidota bacterium]
MNKVKIYEAENEPVLGYKKGSKERLNVEKAYNEMFNSKVDIPLYIGSDEILTNDRKNILPPHDHKNIVGTYSQANENHVNDAIKNLLDNKKSWSETPWEKRCEIFLKAADLISKDYRAKITAGTMIGQSKNIFQAEIDAACEFVDFLKFNVSYLTEIYNEQPIDGPGKSNHLEYRPLEGFVYSVTPFNFTAIGGNLCASAALMGNVVLWKPSDNQVLTAKITMDIFKEAGLPDGVINMVTGDPEMITDIALKHPEFSGLHFTGSTSVFRDLWKKIGNNINLYRDYPRIVGETGGKDFIFCHPSANIDATSTAIIRGAFEYQGQKCSAASRIYIPNSISKNLINKVIDETKTIKMGSPIDFNNFMTAVIHKGAFERISSYIDYAKSSDDCEILCGGNYDDTVGYFVEPTIILTTNHQFKTMKEEIFGPVVTLYVYDDENWEEMLDIVDKTSDYALTGAFISQDEESIKLALNKLKYSAGNFYVNDKPSGAVVGQQPFGGCRASGTDDKAGSKLNLLRWVSPRLVSRTHNPPTSYPYDYMD